MFVPPKPFGIPRSNARVRTGLARARKPHRTVIAIYGLATATLSTSTLVLTTLPEYGTRTASALERSALRPPRLSSVSMPSPLFETMARSGLIHTDPRNRRSAPQTRVYRRDGRRRIGELRPGPAPGPPIAPLLSRD